MRVALLRRVQAGIILCALVAWPSVVDAQDRSALRDGAETCAHGVVSRIDVDTRPVFPVDADDPLALVLGEAGEGRPRRGRVRPDLVVDVDVLAARDVPRLEVVGVADVQEQRPDAAVEEPFAKFLRGDRSHITWPTALTPILVLPVMSGTTIGFPGQTSGMSLFQASFRLRHECPYRELSARYPDLTIREWYLSDCQILELTTAEAPTDDLLDDTEQLGTVLHRSEDETGLHVVVQSCQCALEDSIIERFEAYNCLYQPPTVHRQGWEHYSVIAFEEGAIRGLHDALDADRDIEVLSKTGLEQTTIPESLVAPIDRLVDGLTDRQLAAIQLALDNGYYEQPRQASVSELADRTAVARSTFEEHLRKGENKLVGNLGQFIRLKLGSGSESPLGVEPPVPSRVAASD
jgi:predicted DNA binding protein